MVKKLSDIKKSVENDNEKFYDFFISSLHPEIIAFLFKLMSKTKIYLFSGIIRDFYLNKKKDVKFRDIDIIIQDDLKVEDFFNNWDFTKNSFGGYKIYASNNVIDMWVIKDTWALNNGQLKLEFSHTSELPKTTFFNFSSILYSLNDRSFIIGKDFLRFLRDKKIELVLDKNPNPELCLVNSFYYCDKLKLKLGEKLKKYLKANIDQYSHNLEYIQIKHFNKILYTSTELQNRVQNMPLNE